MKLSPISKAIGAMSALLWLGGPGAVAADPAGAAADDASTQDHGPVQYLTLPVHPRPQADGNGDPHELNPNGIYRRGGHYIWNAPLVNGLPVGKTRNDAPLTPADPAPLAESNGFTGMGLLEVEASSGSAAPYHGETAAAALGSLIVGASNRIYPGSCSTSPCGVVAYESVNGGGSFVTKDIPMTWNGTTFGITFDPAVDYDKVGNFYYSLGGAPLSSNYPNSIAVSKRDADGNWGTPVAVTFNRRSYFDDKYWIAVDRSNTSFANRIYVAWDRNAGNNQILYVSSSSNGGASWSSPIKVDDGKSKFERVIGAYPAVDHGNGTVYVSWHNYARNVIYVDKSTNGGVTWGTDVAAATTNTGFGMDIGCVGGRRQSPAHHLKVGPSGTLHLVYANNVGGKGYDILYKRSTNGGATWSAPVTLNDDTGGAHQFHPTLSVSGTASNEVVSVTFYDRRHDATNCQTTVYSTRSFNGGASWSTNARISTGSWNFDGNANGPGDYSSSAPAAAGDLSFYSTHPGTYEVNAALAQ
jgi:hypothetical protein